jgi:hypothetical protein
MRFVFQCALLLDTAVCLRGFTVPGIMGVDGILLLVGLQDGVKDPVAKEVLAVIQVIVSSEFSVDVVSLYCVEMCVFLLVVEDLHRVVYGVKGVCLF